MEAPPRTVDDDLVRCDQQLQQLQTSADAALDTALRAFAAMLQTAFDAKAREVVTSRPEVTHRLNAAGTLAVLKARLAAMRRDAESTTRETLAGSRMWSHRQPRVANGEGGGEFRPVSRGSGPMELPFDLRADVDALGKPFDELFKEFGYTDVALNFGSAPLSDDVVTALIEYADTARPWATLWATRTRLADQRDRMAALQAWEAA